MARKYDDTEILEMYDLLKAVSVYLGRLHYVYYTVDNNEDTASLTKAAEFLEKAASDDAENILLRIKQLKEAFKREEDNIG